MKEAYKLNKEWLDLLLERKNNENITYNLSNNDIRILLTYIEVLQQENKKLKIQVSSREENKKQKEVIDTIKNILNNQMNYREFVDIVNAIEEVIKEAE